MKYISKKLVAVMMIMAILSSMTVVFAAEDANPEMEVEQVQLTEKQIKELDALYKKGLKNKKKIISKYVEYGVMSAEKGDKIISKMEGHYEKLKQTGYIPHWDKCKHHHRGAEDERNVGEQENSLGQEGNQP